MHETHPRLLAKLEELRVTFAYVRHLLARDLRIMQWNGPVGGSLENGQRADSLRYLRDCLDGGGSSTDDSHPFILEFDILHCGQPPITDAEQGSNLADRGTSCGHRAV